MNNICNHKTRLKSTTLEHNGYSNYICYGCGDKEKILICKVCGKKYIEECNMNIKEIKGVE